MSSTKTSAGQGGGVNISGSVGSVAGDIVGRDKIQIGFSADQVRMLIEAASRQGADEKLADVSQRLGVTLGAMRTMLLTVGEAEVPDERLVEKLAEVVARYREAIATIAALRQDNPVAQEHVSRASEAAAAGDRDEARRQLQAARAVALSAAEQACRLALEAGAAAAKQTLQAARATKAEAELALAALDYPEAARLFAEAAALVSATEPDEKGALLWLQAASLYTHGDERGDNTALRQAIQVYHCVLDLLTRERVPLRWAGVQNDLGNTLKVLGVRESGTARLKEAVAAYRAALEEITRERVPLQWAGVQNNLGAALQVIGEREKGTARLEEAVAAYRAALKERTRERVPLQWAEVQNNLGNTLKVLGVRKSGTARLEEAVAAYRAALEEMTRERVPLQWATTQNNLGAALKVLGALQALDERESGTARLEEAALACRAALEEMTRERVPISWATTQNNLGNVLQELGVYESGTARLEEAVVAYRAALEVTAAVWSPEWVAQIRERQNAALTEIKQRKGRPHCTRQRQTWYNWVRGVAAKARRKWDDKK